jgi:2-(3-amino-3-carboxypropyl)histidine synthase
MRILLQFPEGLKQEALKHAKELEAEGNEVFISASPTFGACDLAIDEARSIGAEKLVHFGHAEFKHVDFNVEYVEYRIDAPLDLLPKSLEVLKAYRKICLMTTIQHIHQLGAIRDFYKNEGKEIVFNKPNGFAKNEGQLLGCDPGNVRVLDKEVDAFVYFGGGMFHPIGALLQTTKPFLIIDPFQKRVERIDAMRETYSKRSRGRVLAAMNAKKFGILVSTKNGQYNIGLATDLKKRIEAEGNSAAILVSNTFDFESINNMMEFDAFVNTACPRISLDDSERLRKPLLSAEELGAVLKLRKK